MQLFNYFLIFLLKCICCKGALLIWSNKKLHLPALSKFSDNEFELLMEKMGNPETFIFKNPSDQLQKELKSVIKHYHSAYSPNGNLHYENVTVLLDDGPLDVMKIQETVDDPDRMKDFLAVIIIPNEISRQKRDANDETNDEDKEDEAKNEDNNIKEKLAEEKGNEEEKPNQEEDEEEKNEKEENINKEEKEEGEEKNKEKEEKEKEKEKQNKEQKEGKEKSKEKEEQKEKERENKLKERQEKERKKQKEEEAKPFVYKKPEGSVMYLKKSTKNDLYTLLYSSKPLILKLKDGQEIPLGNTSEDMITVDSRLNINIPLDIGKITLRFSFSKLYGYWSLTSVKITGTDKDLNLHLNATSNIEAAIHFSYHCSDKTIFTDAKKENSLYLYDMQVQIDSKKPRFSDAADCVNFTTVPIWSGLFVTALLGIGLVVALTAMLDIKTMDKFDNQKTKQLTITVFE